MFRKFAKSILKKLGYDFVDIGKYNIKIHPTPYPHELVIPRATYAPWSNDQSFQNAFQKIKRATLVDAFRCYELWDLSQESSGVEGDIIEVGAWKGGTAALMGLATSNEENPPELYVCDTFEGVVKASEKDSKYKGGEHENVEEEGVKELFEGLGLFGRTQILEGIFPDDTGEQVKDRKFRLCHIDVDVHDSAKEATEWLWPRVPVGGMLVYDDYGFSGTDGVTRFVESQKRKKDRIVFHNLNGHGIIIKIA